MKLSIRVAIRKDVEIFDVNMEDYAAQTILDVMKLRSWDLMETFAYVKRDPFQYGLDLENPSDPKFWEAVRMKLQVK